MATTVAEEARAPGSPILSDVDELILAPSPQRSTRQRVVKKSAAVPEEADTYDATPLVSPRTPSKMSEPLRKIDSFGRSIDITALDLRQGCIGERGAARLAAALACGERALSKLDLCGNYMSTAGITFVLGALERHCTLLKLDLSWNGVDDEGAARVAKFVKKMPHMEELDLSYNRISDPGAEDIGAALPECRLRRLDLRGNPLGTRGARKLRAGRLKAGMYAPPAVVPASSRKVSRDPGSRKVSRDPGARKVSRDPGSRKVSRQHKIMEDIVEQSPNGSAKQRRGSAGTADQPMRRRASAKGKDSEVSPEKPARRMSAKKGESDVSPEHQPRRMSAKKRDSQGIAEQPTRRTSTKTEDLQERAEESSRSFSPRGIDHPSRRGSEDSTGNPVQAASGSRLGSACSIERPSWSRPRLDSADSNDQLSWSSSPRQGLDSAGSTDQPSSSALRPRHDSTGSAGQPRWSTSKQGKTLERSIDRLAGGSAKQRKAGKPVNLVLYLDESIDGAVFDPLADFLASDEAVVWTSDVARPPMEALQTTYPDELEEMSKKWGFAPMLPALGGNSQTQNRTGMTRRSHCMCQWRGPGSRSTGSRPGSRAMIMGLDKRPLYLPSTAWPAAAQLAKSVSEAVLAGGSCDFNWKAHSKRSGHRSAAQLGSQ